MNLKIVVTALVAVAVAVAAAGEVEPTLPDEWSAFMGGGRDALPGRCELGVDPDLIRLGTRNMTAKCAMDVPSHGGLYQRLSAQNYRGKRIRYSALLRAENIADIGNATGVGGLWIRVEGPNPAEPLLIDNMRERGIRGSVDWTQAEIIVDIPSAASVIHFGFWMQGRGQIWITDVKFEDAPAFVPVTGLPAPPQDSRVPRNLRLE